MEAQQNNIPQMNVGGNAQMPQQQPQFNANAETNTFGQGGQNIQQMPQTQSQPSDANAGQDASNFEEGGEINNNDKLTLNWGLVFTFFK